MLDDAMVMVGLYIVQDKDLVALAHGFGLTKKASVEVYDDVTPEQRERLYELARRMNSGNKVTLSVFDGSSLLTQLTELGKYNIDVEVCTPQFRREYSSWSERTHTTGNLNLRRMEA